MKMVSPKAVVQGAILTLLLANLRVDAQTPKILDLKARLFLQHSGELSSPITGRENLWNVVSGGDGVPGPATSALVDVAVRGAPNSFVGASAVHLLVSNKRTGKVIDKMTSSVGGFGSSGESHVGFWLHSIGCEPLELVASTEGSSKSLTLPFRCGE